MHAVRFDLPGGKRKMSVERATHNSGGLLITRRPLDVLYVEDDPVSAQYIEAGLAGSASVQVARTLAEALSLMMAMTFDVILLGLGLPDSIGIEGLTRLRTRTDVPIIVITGHEEVGDEFEVFVQRVGLAGGNGYLIKGISHADVRRTLWLAKATYHCDKLGRIIAGGSA